MASGRGRLEAVLDDAPISSRRPPQMRPRSPWGRLPVERPRGAAEATVSAPHCVEARRLVLEGAEEALAKHDADMLANATQPASLTTISPSGSESMRVTQEHNEGYMGDFSNLSKSQFGELCHYWNMKTNRSTGWSMLRSEDLLLGLH